MGIRREEAVNGLLTNPLTLRIKITTTHSITLEGTLFTYCPLLNVVALNTAPLPSAHSLTPPPADYHIIPVSRVQSLNVLSSSASDNTNTSSTGGVGDVNGMVSGFDKALPALRKLDTKALREREERAVRKAQEVEAKRGKGVSAEAQTLFNALDRM